ncbi:MAG: biotin/lipoyl-containing protein, partial [Giesbergeria sp.]
MGIYAIRVPDIGEGIAEVELVVWHVQPGDTVAEDQSIADVMTDKATVEIPSPVAGKVVALGSAVGDTIAVGSELVRLEVEGAGNLKENSAPAPVHNAKVAPVSIAKDNPPAAAPTQPVAPAQIASAPSRPGA